MVMPAGYDTTFQSAPTVRPRPLPESDRAIVIVGTSLGATPTVTKPGLILLRPDDDIGTAADPKIVSATGTLRNAIIAVRSMVRDNIILAVAEDPTATRLAAVEADYDKLVAAAHLASQSAGLFSGVVGRYYCAPEWTFNVTASKPVLAGANPVATALKSSGLATDGIAVFSTPPSEDADTPWAVADLVSDYAGSNGGTNAFIVSPTFYTGARVSRDPAAAVCGALAAIPNEAQSPLRRHVNLVGLPDQLFSHNPNLGEDSDSKTLTSGGIAALVQGSGGWQIWGADLAVGVNPAPGVIADVGQYLGQKHIERALNATADKLVNQQFPDVLDDGAREFEHTLAELATDGYINGARGYNATPGAENSATTEAAGRAYFDIDYVPQYYTRRISTRIYVS